MEVIMDFDDIISVVNANPTNKFITQHLGNDTMELVIEIMEKLDAKDFKEICESGEFQFDDLPIPYSRLLKNNSADVGYSKELAGEFVELLEKINSEGTNIEYPFVISSSKDCDEYCNIKKFANGGSQTCTFDWQWIDEFIKNCDDKIRFSLVHTHPNPLGVKQKTLYNKYTEELGECGVLPNGLNISLADVYGCQYLQMLVDKYGKDIDVESTILMFDGTLVSFGVKNGMGINNIAKVQNVSDSKLESQSNNYLSK